MLRPSFLLLVSAMVCAPVYGQGNVPVGAGSPGFDLSGTWVSTPNEEITGNPSVVDYLAIPLNAG